jgi:hypothetical protein
MTRIVEYDDFNAQETDSISLSLFTWCVYIFVISYNITYYDDAAGDSTYGNTTNQSRV